MRVMAFGAHPDDVEIFASGTLAKYRAQGHEIGIAIMTRGDVGSPTLTRDEIAEVREKEARNAAAMVDAEFYWLGHDDEFLYDTPEVRRQVIDVIRQFQPDIVLCPDKDKDYHPDHVRTGQIVWDTHVMATVPLIPTGHPVCKKIHEIWYYDTAAGVGFEPGHYVDISAHWETKVKMVECHDSQNAWCKHMYGIPVTYFAETQSRFRGYQSGCTFAEAFRKPPMFPHTAAGDGLLPVALG